MKRITRAYTELEEAGKASFRRWHLRKETWRKRRSWLCVYYQGTSIPDRRKSKGKSNISKVLCAPTMCPALCMSIFFIILQMRTSAHNTFCLRSQRWSVCGGTAIELRHACDILPSKLLEVGISTCSLFKIVSLLINFGTPNWRTLVYKELQENHFLLLRASNSIEAEKFFYSLIKCF